ncbi:MAG: tail fiber domain-containing protein [Deltaproteobacteria bacterium]|nr:tail fiber domain-containing protein [Deltaproteobacteria bacterium]
MRRPKGFSLAGVIVATGIGAIIIGFISEMIIFQYKDQKYLSQKMEITDFTNTLLSTFAKPSNCSCQFQNNVTNPNLANFAALHFDSTNTTGSEIIAVTNLYSGCSGGLSSPLLLASNNQPLYGARDLIVDTVKLINLKPSGGGANPRDWQGQWQIQFKVGPGSLSKPSPPVLVTQKFTIDDTNPSIALISSCNGISTGTGTTNYLAKWSGISGMLMDSGIFEEPALKRVGIGTVAPEDALEVVEGAGRGITATRYGQVGPRGGAVQVRGSRGTQAAPTAVQAGDYLGWFYGSGYNGVGFTNHAAPTSMAIQSTETWDATSNGGKLVFKTIPNGATASIDRMVINESGNVGIGTATPSEKFEVDGNIRVNASGANGIIIQALAAFPNDPGDLQWKDFNGTLRARIHSNNQPQADLYFYVNGTDRMIIDNAGKVGIGTTAPRTELDLNAGTISGGFPGTHGGTTAPVCYDGTTGVMDACVSLKKFKKNIQPLDIGLEEILRLQPVAYELKSNGYKEIGFIAEEAIRIDERFAQKSSLGKIVGVKYSQMVALLAKGIQQLHSVDNVLKKRIEELELESKALKTEMKTLKDYVCTKDPAASMCAVNLNN